MKDIGYNNINRFKFQIACAEYSFYNSYTCKATGKISNSIFSDFNEIYGQHFQNDQGSQR